MKIDINEIKNYLKFDKLLQDSVYNELYKKSSKYYEQLLPEHVTLYKLFLKDFVNYDTSEDFGYLVPNKYAELAILIGCQEYTIYEYKGLKEEKRKELQLYFHCINLRDYIQYIKIVHCDKKDYLTGRYFKGSDFICSLSSVDGHNDKFKQIIYDYIDKDKIFEKLYPRTEELNALYVRKNFIEIPF